MSDIGGSLHQMECLVIGRRDAASNSAVIRKQLGKNDIIFHARYFWFAIFILKDAKNVPIQANEVAHATVCFSRAWREGIYGVSAFLGQSRSGQKISAPSGQFLPKRFFHY